MLKGISPLLSPDLLYVLAAMGHGDTLVLVDAHYPAASSTENCLRADGVQCADLLNALLPLFELDAYCEAPVMMMRAIDGDQVPPDVIADYRSPIDIHQPGTVKTAFIDRFEFYDKAREAFAIVQTGEVRKYGCIILTKGITPVS